MATIQREVFPWGVKLSVRPFAKLKAEIAALAIHSEVSLPKEAESPQVKVNFTTVPWTFSLRLTEAQLWHEAFGALIEETRNVMASMKAEKPKPSVKPAKSAKPAKGKRRS
jgi:hypothetical protein